MAESHRAVTAHAVIAIGLVGAAQMLWVSPARERAEEAGRELVALRAVTASDPTSVVAKLETRERRAQERLHAIEEANAYADPARIVDLVQRLGDGAGVVIQRIDPKVVEPRSGLRQGDRRAHAMPTSGVVVTVEAHGGYRDVARFVGALEGRPGFTRTDEVSVRPSLTPGRDDVGVVIRTAQLAFDPDAFVPAVQGPGADG